MIKISIIIPVYNVEEYLEKCLDSVINQTLKEIEIICINDGSTDNSKVILENYAKRDKRIKIFNQKNLGLSASRNKGIKYATGEYIFFIDADDWIELNTCEITYDFAKERNLDLLLFGAKHIDFEGNTYDDNYYNLSCFENKYEGEVFNYKTIINKLFLLDIHVWDKLFKTEVLRNNCIIFPLINFEDNPFFYEVLLNCERVSILKNCFYYYFKRDNSIMNAFDDRFLDMIAMSNLVIESFKKNNKYCELKKELLNFKLDIIKKWYPNFSFELKEKFLHAAKKDFIEWRKNLNVDYLNTPNKNFYKWVLEAENPLEYDLLEKNHSLNCMQKKVDDLKKENNTLINQINHRNEIINTLNTQISKSNKKNKSLKDKNKSLKDRNRVLKDKNKALKDKNKELNKFKKDVLTSNSWKLTKPLRKIKNYK